LHGVRIVVQSGPVVVGGLHGQCGPHPFSCSVHSCAYSSQFHKHPSRQSSPAHGSKQSSSSGSQVVLVVDEVEVVVVVVVVVVGQAGSSGTESAGTHCVNVFSHASSGSGQKSGGRHWQAAVVVVLLLVVVLPSPLVEVVLLAGAVVEVVVEACGQGQVVVVVELVVLPSPVVDVVLLVLVVVVVLQPSLTRSQPPDSFFSHSQTPVQGAAAVPKAALKMEPEDVVVVVEEVVVAAGSGRSQRNCPFFSRVMRM
jgi:hypothetical protein